MCERSLPRGPAYMLSPQCRVPNWQHPSKIGDKLTVVHMRQPTLAAAKKKVAEFAFMSAAMSSSLHEGNCVYRKLKPGRSDGEARRGWGVNE